MSQFVTETLSAALAALVDRRRKLQTMLDEAVEIDLAIREQRKVLKRLGVQTVRAVAAQPRTAAEPQVARAEPRAGTNAERALALLRSHPRGLNTNVIARDAEIAQGSVSVVLSDLVRDGRLVKVGRGFWRIPGADDAAVGSASTGA